ncbi:MAG: PaaI family thioesterase [Nitriliruptorales bacterium]
MDLDLDAARQLLAAQSLSVLLGAEVVEFSPDRTVLVVPIRDEHLQQNGLAHGGLVWCSCVRRSPGSRALQQNGLAHGGLVAYAADNAITFAAGAAVGPDVLTAETNANHVAGARGSRLEARATVVNVSRRLVTVRCDAFDGDESRLCAVAQGTVARVGSD